VIANAIANKIIVVGNLTMTASVVAYSMIFLVTDLITEVWGRREAQKAVWCGFYGVVLLVITSQIALHWEAASFAIETAEGFEKIFGTTIRVAIGSMAAYLVSQHYDIYAFTFLKKKTHGKYLWIRNNGSTITSQLISTIIFITIAFYGVLPIIPLIIGQWLVKSAIAVIDTPFLYLMRYIVQKTSVEGKCASIEKPLT
jgi:hypothetical protein